MDEEFFETYIVASLLCERRENVGLNLSQRLAFDD